MDEIVVDGVYENGHITLARKPVGIGASRIRVTFRTGEPGHAGVQGNLASAIPAPAAAGRRLRHRTTAHARGAVCRANGPLQVERS